MSVEHTPPTPSLSLYTALQYCLLGELLLILRESVKFYIHTSPKWVKYFLCGAKAPPHTPYTITCVLFIYFCLSRLWIQGPGCLFLLVYALHWSQCLAWCSTNVRRTYIKTVIAGNIMAKINLAYIGTFSCSKLRKAVWLYDGHLICSWF